MGSLTDDNVTTAASTEPEIRNARDFTPIDPTKPFTKTIRVGRYLKSINEGWTASSQEMSADKKMYT